jgi:hypothetical protein
MRKFIGLTLFIVCWPGIVVAAQIYGNLKEGSRSVGQGVEVSITCNGKPQKVVTDSYGAYNLYVPQSGKCMLTVFYGNQWSQPHHIFSSEEPTRYDFDLIRLADGSFSLKRR